MTVGWVSGGVCAEKRDVGSSEADAEEGQAGSLRARPHREALTEGAIWESTRRNFILNWEQIIVPGCMSHPVTGTLSITLKKGDCIEEIAKFIFSFFS